MSANPPLPAEAHTRPGSVRLRWVIWGGAALAGIAIAAVIALVGSTRSAPAGGSSDYTTFAAGSRLAPNFALTDEHGETFTLASLRGRPVIVTFIDPYCRDFCPREASILTEAAAKLGAQRPAIVSVSVDPWADTPANFSSDKVHWKLGPTWRWGVGSYAQLAPVWKDYGVGVTVTTRKIAGITIRKIIHSGAAYLVDASGHERALFLYPFTTGDVVGAAKKALAT